METSSFLAREVDAMQNPALGAVLLWRLACGYCPSGSSAGVPLQLLFLGLPMLLHARTREAIETTRTASGIRKFHEKFAETGDVLSGLHNRALQMRHLSLRSLSMSLAGNLLALVPADGSAWPRTYTEPVGLAEGVVKMMRAATRLGTWFADVTLFETSGLLRVEF